MLTRVEWLVAGRYMRARRQEGFVSVIAWVSLISIALGVATLIIVTSVMNGFRADLVDRILGLNGHLSVVGPQRALSDYDDLARAVGAIDGVEAVAPLVEGRVLASSGRRSLGAVVRGMRPDDLRAKSLVADAISIGELQSFGAPETAVMGERLARSLGLQIGDRVRLLSPQGSAGDFRTAPKSQAFEVVALFDVGMHEYDSAYLYIPLASAQTYFDSGGTVTHLEVVLTDNERLGQVRPLVETLTQERGDIRDWQQLNTSLFNALQVERTVMFLILTLIILVAAFNIITGLVMLVKDKGADIAVLRTLGSSKGLIMRVFMIAGASIGVIGTIAGGLLGLAVATNMPVINDFFAALSGRQFSAEVAFLSRLPSVVDAREVALILVLALALSIIATIYPSWRAARLDPVEALRYE